jgi:predicted RNase H-like HicB family nuclease
MKYTVVFEREPDGGYVVSVPALPGCNSQGDTREEALANVREAAELYVSHFRARGETVPAEVDIASIEVDVSA